jgi:predicted RNA-binding protein with PIN domain
MLGGSGPYHGRMRVLVVDGANVMGSRPDGWWRDRAGAAQRLHEQLSAADLPYDEIVLVLEGAAKEGRPEGHDGHLHTVHAPGSGDDAIVDAVTDHLATEDGHEVVVVTADRALRARVETTGGRCLGPAWLLQKI